MKTITQLLCLLAFVCFANTTQAQTKEETVKWLTEKMMSPNFFQYDGTSPSEDNKTVIHKLNLEDNLLTISGKYSKKGYIRGDKWTSDYTFEYIIDLSQLSDDEIFIYSRGFISKKQSIKTKLNVKYLEEGLMPSNENSESLNGTTNLTINSNFDVDIVERFTKALQHYKTLMTVKKSTETF